MGIVKAIAKVMRIDMGIGIHMDVDLDSGHRHKTWTLAETST